ncbi:MAG: hypothetical protein LQ350_004333 [Teloschistes chrysophthalmus]|nr:MAG: hypothetical protein LQ350_004333 [Niorma chrysophthalma]
MNRHSAFGSGKNKTDTHVESWHNSPSPEDRLSPRPDNKTSHSGPPNRGGAPKRVYNSTQLAAAVLRLSNGFNLTASQHNIIELIHKQSTGHCFTIGECIVEMMVEESVQLLRLYGDTRGTIPFPSAPFTEVRIRESLKKPYFHEDGVLLARKEHDIDFCNKVMKELADENIPRTQRIWQRLWRFQSPKNYGTSRTASHFEIRYDKLLEAMGKLNKEEVGDTRGKLNDD